MANRISQPVILNSSLDGSEIQRLLSKFYKLRVTDSTLKHSIIFPKCSVAFLIQPLCEVTTVWPPRGKYFMDENAIERIKRFVKLHRNSFVFLTCQHITPEERIVWNAVQAIFIDEPGTFLLACGAAECINMIMEVIDCKDKVTMELEETKRLIRGDLDERCVCNILERNLNVSPHDALVLQDGCGSLSDIASAQVKDLMECSLSREVAERVNTFFVKDSVR